METKLRFALLAVTLIVTMFFFNQTAQCAAKPSRVQNPYSIFMGIPGQGTPPRVPDFTTKEKHSQFSVNLVQDTSTFSLVPTPFDGFVGGEAVWCDYDNDGNMDVLVSGWNDTVFTTKIYHNEGGSFVDINANISGRGTFRGIAWGDYDNDGDLDLAISGAKNWEGDSSLTQIFRNDNGVFVDIGASLMPLNFGSMNWVDYDNDGDLDLFCTGSPDHGSTFVSKLYENDDGVFNEIPTGIVGVWGSCSAWGDYDNDGLQDLAVMGWGGANYTRIYHNNGDGTFTDINAPFVQIVHGSICWVDYDNDGLLDISIEGSAIAYVPITKIYKNMGNGVFTDINANILPLEVGSMAWGDYDNDGNLDFAIAGARDWFGDSAMTMVYHNDGNGVFTNTGVVFPGLYSSSVAWGDYDNDGRLDLLMAGARMPSMNMPPTVNFLPLTLIYQNRYPVYDAKPAAPPALAAHVNGQSIEFGWNAASDDHTPSKALTYNLRIGTSPGGINVLQPYSIPATGYRRIAKPGNAGARQSFTIKNLPDGKYYWSVQAVDNELAGSSFASEQVITVGSSSSGASTGWQLISVPYTHADNHTTVLYPTALTNSYEYVVGAGYQSSDVLENGKGYWLKFNPLSPDPVISGGTVTAITVPVVAGWNLIGSISIPILPASITSGTPGMTTTAFFGYNGGYVTADTIQPGKGYWVKVNQTGSLTLGSSSAAAGQSAIRIVPSNEQPPSPPVIESVGPGIPTEFSLSQNYPNPFNPSTKIQFSLPQATHMTLTVFNLLGEEVATLISGEITAGEHVQEWNAANLSSGMYFYRLQAGSFSDTKKLVILK